MHCVFTVTIFCLHYYQNIMIRFNNILTIYKKKMKGQKWLFTGIVMLQNNCIFNFPQKIRGI